MAFYRAMGIHDLAARLWTTRWGRAAFSLVALSFLAVQVSHFCAPLMPDSRAKFPWGMFSIKSGPSRDYRAYGVTADGQRVPIPIERWFRFRRGFSEHTSFFQHRAMKPHIKGATAERRRLSRWLAQRLYAEDGIRVEKVELEYRYWPFGRTKMRTRLLATVPIRSRDYSGVEKLVY